MRRFYPALQLQNDPCGDLFWQGAVTPWTGNDYEIQLRYSDSFPYRPPKAYVINPKIEQSRHIYPDGHLCLFHKDDKAWEPDTTGATVMSWISLWLHCYEVWLLLAGVHPNQPRVSVEEAVVKYANGPGPRKVR